MILADKIITERKKNGWSQEELAEKLDVSRQSVSKWEGAQATPDLQKILKMSELFGVSTDYLLKDELEDTQYIETESSVSNVRRVSMEEANAFLQLNARTSRRIALAASLGVLSPICLILMGGMAEKDPNMENVAVSIGMIVLLLMAAAAVALFIINGMQLSKYEYLEKEVIETAYGVSGMVKDKKEKYATKHIRNIVTGVVLCILGVIALFFVPLSGEDAVVGATMVCVLLIFVAAGLYFLISSGCIQDGFDKLLQEGDYNIGRKKDHVTRIVAGVYWLTITAIYLGWSFVTNNWDRTWIIWPVAGVMFPAVIGISRLLRKQYDR
ncbi:MAG: helix-turn-helix transcriptional regulator [Oscillospiraceae bacterium]|nr:helix-turn-helix transcriptional regulator [Oscillospiraceae bacterium]